MDDRNVQRRDVFGSGKCLKILGNPERFVPISRHSIGLPKECPVNRSPSRSAQCLIELRNRQGKLMLLLVGKSQEP